MKRDSFTQALRATARVACAASLLNVGCKVKTPSQVATPNTAPKTTNTAAKQTPDTIRDSENSSDPTEETYAECQPFIKDIFANDNFPEAESISQEVKDCCALTAAYYDALAIKSGNGMYDYTVIDGWKHRDQCCTAIEWSDGSTACTPWGPPTPPSAQKMRRRIIVRQHAVLA